MKARRGLTCQTRLHMHVPPCLYYLTSYLASEHQPRPSPHRSPGDGRENLSGQWPCWLQLDNVALRFKFLFDMPEELIMRISCTLHYSQDEPLHRRDHPELLHNHAFLVVQKLLRNTLASSVFPLPSVYWPLGRAYSSMMHSLIRISM